MENIEKSQGATVNHQDQTITIHAQKTELNFREVQNKCDTKKLKVNEQKTKLLAKGNNRYKTDCWIKTPDGETIISGSDLKLLGFIFGEKPDCKKQIKHLIRRAGAKFFVLRHYATFMPGDELKTILCPHSFNFGI